jgi:hypothetical protein
MNLKERVRLLEDAVLKIPKYTDKVVNTIRLHTLVCKHEPNLKAQVDYYTTGGDLDVMEARARARCEERKRQEEATRVEEDAGYCNSKDYVDAFTKKAHTDSFERNHARLINQRIRYGNDQSGTIVAVGEYPAIVVRFDHNKNELYLESITDKHVSRLI